ncbi:MAG: AzlC family ABC transporter permease [Clostridiales bacterium]|nr:AzlC family ABC transporter permease [Clostridiales bacterium]
MKNNNNFLKGVTDGLPICFGYFSVAFAFGIFAVGGGLNIAETLLISMTNVTSAGQLAAVPIIASGGTLIELAVSQLIINLRYALMSISLSQKLDGNVRMLDRFIVSFVNTDEVFAVASAQNGTLGRKYLYGLILTPYIGWSVGTLVGAAAGNVLPKSVIAALGVAIYAMFIAIVVPEMKRSRSTALCVAVSVLLSCIFRYTPGLKLVPSGFVIIICAVLASSLFAVLSPVDSVEDENEG